MLNQQAYKRKLRKRHRKNKMFKFICGTAIIFSALFLCFFFYDIISKAIPAFTKTEVEATLDYKEAHANADPTDAGTVLGDSGFAVDDITYEMDVLSRKAFWHVDDILEEFQHNPEKLPEPRTDWFLASSSVDQFVKNDIAGKLNKEQQAYIRKLQEEGKIRTSFSLGVITNDDNNNPEVAGLKGALIGSAWIILVTILVSVPIGVMTAIYLEEYAPKNKFTAFIEVNINNLAAIPSIIFGLLGLLVFIGVFGVPRSSPLAAGLTLGLMMLPIIIISTRASLRAIPTNIREAALAVGASKWQTVQHHVLPLAVPGIVTGTILSMAQAMGETAPLLIVGLNAAVTKTPSAITDDSNSLPTLIFQWSNYPERGFEERTAAAILFMLIILIVMNATAVWMRNKFERRW